MDNTISNKALILTDYENLTQLIIDILSPISIIRYSENNSLSSLNELQNSLSEKGNLSFLKKDILSFIGQNGYPFITVLDMKISSGLSADNGASRILKTLLLSYIIIMQSEQYKNISCNLLILSDKEDYKNFKEKHKQPQKILSLLKTNDDRLNDIIREYSTNEEKFKKNFNILITDAEQETSLIRSELVLFTNMIKAKERLKSKIMKEKEVYTSVPKTGAAQSADVVLRAGKIIFRNGEAPSVYDEELNLSDGEVYILGNFTSYTRLDVIDRLLCLIKAGFGSEFSLKKDEALILNIPQSSIIDSTTPITLAQLISKELQDYKNIRIKTTSSNYRIMQQSKGFSMIQRNVIIHEF